MPLEYRGHVQHLLPLFAFVMKPRLDRGFGSDDLT